MLFFVSQLILVTVGSITQLWIASLLLGLAHGSLYSLYPTLCLEWFGMGTYQHLPPLKNLSHSYPNSFFFRSSGSFTQHSPLFWKLGISRYFTLSRRKYLFPRIWTKSGCSRSSSSSLNIINIINNSFTFPSSWWATASIIIISIIIHRPSPMLERIRLLRVCYLSNLISNAFVYRTLRLGWI